MKADGAYGIAEDMAASRGVRPAMNLNLGQVKFISAAVGGKASGAVGPNALTPVPATAPTEWKLTVFDDTYGGFAVTTTAVAATTAGGNVSIDYSGANKAIGDTANPSCLSAMLVDAAGTVQYYGRLKTIAQNYERGSQAIAIPAGLAVGNYTLQVFVEQCNGDRNTDYTSELKAVALTVTLPNYAIALESPAGTPLVSHTFPGQTVNYDAAAVPKLTVTVRNTGALATGKLQASLSGGNPSAFLAPASALGNIDPGSTGSFDVQVAPSLLTGDYEATVTVGPASDSSNQIPPKSFPVRFSVGYAPVGIAVATSGSTRFSVGGAPGNAVFTVTSLNYELLASVNYAGATLDDSPLLLGSVGAPGPDGSVEDGSLVLTIHQAKLNTLDAGSHTLAIALQNGVFADMTVNGVITVDAPGGADGDLGADVPKTGDGAPLLPLCAVALLCGMGLVIRTRKRKRG